MKCKITIETRDDETGTSVTTREGDEVAEVLREVLYAHDSEIGGGIENALVGALADHLESHGWPRLDNELAPLIANLCDAVAAYTDAHTKYLKGLGYD